MAPAARDEDHSIQVVSPLDLSLLGETQQNAMKKLKLSLSEEDYAQFPFLSDENYLIHWLKARKYDVDRANAMLRNHLRYRKALKFDEPNFERLPLSVHPVMQKYYSRGQFGYTKKGHPIVYFPFGGIDPKGLVHSMRLSDCFHAVLIWQEERRRSCVSASQRAGILIQQAVYIFDLKGICTKHLYRTGLEVFQQIAKIVEQHTPEIIYKIRVINAPTLFYAIFKIVKPILDENTLRKIQVYGTDGWKEALLDEADADQIPAYYGGNAVGKNGDVKCEHRIRYGGEVPEDLYFTEKQRGRLIPDEAKLTEVTIPRGQQIHLKITVDTPGSLLYWYLESRSASDVGFGVFRDASAPLIVASDASRDPIEPVPQKLQANTASMEMVYPYFRLLVNIVPEWNHITIDQPGTYIVQFDNSYSWMYSKTIQYYAAVVKPNSDLLNLLPLE